ncbi:phage tail protein [Shinella sp. BYT-45]|uniref:phage tail protein n=1 Tax=Shinella sp. BYT-45 TaxID=3377377 RepID=UPI00397FA987
MTIFTGIATAIGGLLGGTFLSGAVGTFLLKAAVGIGLNLLASAIAGKPEQPQHTFAVQGQLQAGGDIPRSFIIGRTATAGSLVYANTWGDSGKTPNAFFTQVIALSDLPTQELSGIWVNGERCTLLPDTPHAELGLPVLEYRSNGEDHLWIKFYDGTQTQADSFLVNHASSAERPYEATRVGRGVSYAICTARIDENLFTGFPSFKFELLGLRLYDVTKDSTAGGSGPHRLSDPSTWGGDGDELPAVQAYNLLLGVKYASEWFYGLQNMSAARLPAADWRAQIGKCRLQVAKPGGGTEEQYLTGLEIQVSAQIASAAEAILTGCQGRLIDSGGIYKIRVGAPDAAVFSFSDGDILSTERQTFSPFFGLADTINGISATYPEPGEGWNAKAAPSIYRPDYEAKDGNRRLMANVELNAVRRASQVQRLMKSALEEARRARRHTIVLGPSAWVLEPGDVVAWTSARNGYVTKLMRVDGVMDKANLDVVLDITEVDPADYSWNPATDYKPPTFGPIGPARPAPQAIVDWFAQPWTLDDGQGEPRRAAMKLSWDGDQDDVEGVAFEVRLAATQEVVYRGRTENVRAGSIIVSQNLLPAQAYEVRGRYIPRGDRETVWSNWLPVTTPDVPVSLDDLAAEIREALEQLREWIDDETIDNLVQDTIELAQAIAAEAQARAQAIANEAAQRVQEIGAEQSARVAGAIEASDRYRSLVDEITTLRDRAMEADFADFKAREEIKRSLVASIESYAASFNERITVAASEIAAVAQRTTSLEARTVELGAEIVTVDLARIEGQNALAYQMSLLSAGTDNQFDPYRFWGFGGDFEGWTGNGTPTITDGYLRPADHASDPYVMSPAGLAVATASYRQVRARVRKYGSPVWEGYCWWAGNGQEWDSGRRTSIAEPVFDGNGIGLLTWNPEWSGTVDRIRLDLSTAQTPTDYYTIDWISVGAPAPGASRAELATERQARIDGDGANASAIDALQARATNLETGVSGLATGVSALETQVTTLGNTLTATANALDALELEVEDKADLNVVNAMSAEIQALGSGLLNQGSMVSAIRGSLLPSAMEGVDQDFANFFGERRGAIALAEASQALNTRIDLTNASLSVVSSALTQVQAIIPGLATSTALNGLTSRVTAAEGNIAANTSAITSINGELPGKASVAALNSLAGTVSSQGDTIASHASAITSINNALPGKASTSALAALEGRVTNTEAGIASNTSAITAINNTLPDKASTSALNALASTVSSQGDAISANTSAITTINNTLPGKASTSSVTALEGRVTTAENNISANTSAISSINAALPNKADASALNSLAATVTSQGNTISSHSSAITSINNALPDKASVSALNSLAGTVTSQGNTISAQATAITGLQTSVGDLSASARSKMEVVSGPGGYARIAWMARAGTTGNYREGGIYLDVPTNTALPVQVIIDAARFAVIDGATKLVPFVVENGELKGTFARFGTVTAGVLRGANGKMKIDVEAGTIEIWT